MATDIQNLFHAFDGETYARPRPLRPGDRIMIVSPASTPTQVGVKAIASILEGWGFVAEIAPHAFDEAGYLAGTDEARLADLNDALNNPDLRAVFCARGGKGSYRIADRLDFGAVTRDPKLLIGFSDITALHMAILRGCGVPGIHGNLSSWNSESIGPEQLESLRKAIMTDEDSVMRHDPQTDTAALTTSGRASGALVGGNLDTLAICAGWALPNLDGCILAIEAIGMGLGHVDRQLTMLANAGHLDGVRGVAVGQFTDFKPSNGTTILDLLGEHLDRLEVPILGGLPFGHCGNAMAMPIGTWAEIDADNGILAVGTAVA